MSETYGQLISLIHSQALRPAIFGAKRRSAVLTEIRLIKKRNKKHVQNRTAFRLAHASTGGCNNNNNLLLSAEVKIQQQPTSNNRF